MPDALNTEVITEWDRLDSIETEWDQLAASIPGTTVFDTALMTLGLAQRDQQGFSPSVAIARNNAGSLVGVLALGRKVLSSGLTRTILVPLAEWHGSSFDAVSSDLSTTRALWAAIVRHGGWDAADLRYLPDDSTLARTFATESHEHGLTKAVNFDPGRGHISPRTIAWNIRRLKRLGELAFEHSAPPDRFPGLVERFAEWHTERWQMEPDATEFAHPSERERLLGILSRAASAGIARVGALSLDNSLLAVHLAFRWGDSQYSWRMANGTDALKYSPGMALFDMVLAAAAREGCRSAVLGRGTENYKEFWHPVATPLLQALVPGPSWRGRLLGARRLFGGAGAR